MNLIQKIIVKLLTDRLTKYKITNPLEYDYLNIKHFTSSYSYEIQIILSQHIISIHFFGDGSTRIMILPIYLKVHKNTYMCCNIQKYSIYFSIAQKYFNEGDEVRNLFRDVFKLNFVGIDGKLYLELQR